MASHVGTKLSRLIRERSYLSGEVGRLQESARRIQAEIADARARLKAIKAAELPKALKRLAEVDRLIQVDAPGIDPNDIR
jgi:prefoldin subunit 5